MTQGKAVQAYIALCHITAEKWGLKDAYALWNLKKRLQGAFDFQADRERELLERYGAQPAEGGKWTFATMEEKDGFTRETAELAAMERFDDPEPVTVTPPAGLGISPDTLGALEGFVTFDLGKGE